jgi:hypothetical protein
MEAINGVEDVFFINVAYNPPRMTSNNEFSNFIHLLRTFCYYLKLFFDWWLMLLCSNQNASYVENREV